MAIISIYVTRILKEPKLYDIIDAYRILSHKILKSYRSFVLFRALHQLTASQKYPCEQVFLLLVK